MQYSLSKLSHFSQNPVYGFDDFVLSASAMIAYISVNCGNACHVPMVILMGAT
jgi:hypothetical protein